MMPELPGIVDELATYSLVASKERTMKRGWFFLNPKRDREKCEEMEKQSNKAKALCQPELKDCKRQDDQGRPICWAYILKKEKAAARSQWQMDGARRGAYLH